MRFDVEEIRSTLSIEHVLASYGVRLRRGRGPCPVCGTSKTSQAFSVKDARWKCFACGAGGDVIELVARLNGATWHEALPVAAKMAGVEKVEGAAKRPKAAERVDEVGKMFRSIAALRDACHEIADNEFMPIELRSDALAGAENCNETLDFIMENHPCR